MGRKPQANVKHPKKKAQAIRKKLEAGKATLTEKAWLKTFDTGEKAKKAYRDNPLFSQLQDAGASPTIPPDMQSSAPRVHSGSLPETEGLPKSETATPPPIDIPDIPMAQATAKNSTTTTTAAGTINSPNPPTGSAKKSPLSEQAQALKANILQSLGAEASMATPEMLAEAWYAGLVIANAQAKSEGFFGLPQSVIDKVVKPCIQYTCMRFCPEVDPDIMAPIVAGGSSAIVFYNGAKGLRKRKARGKTQAQSREETPHTNDATTNSDLLEPEVKEPSDEYKEDFFSRGNGAK